MALFAVITAAVVGGAAHFVNQLLNWFDRQSFTERLPATDYEPKFFATDPLGEAPAETKPGDPTDTDEIDVTEGIEKPNVAIQKGDEARENGDYTDAVNLYLHALKLDPNSSEPKTQLWKTLEIWNETDAPVGRINAGRLEKAAQYATQAAWLLSEYYLHRDRALGLHWLKKSADSGHPADMRKLGIILTPGKFASADHSGGMNWLKRAADKGDAESQFLYGECLIFGEFVEKAPHQGTDYLKLAADQGYADTKELLGVCMVEGIGINPSQKAGFQQLVESAEIGTITANLQIGLCHLHGDGTPRDQTTAVAAFKKGAELGDPKAMYAYALCLDSGVGGRISSDDASEWMKKAADLGHPGAKACHTPAAAADQKEDGSK